MVCFADACLVHCGLLELPCLHLSPAILIPGMEQHMPSLAVQSCMIGQVSWTYSSGGMAVAAKCHDSSSIR